jgi:hypothetical protein
MRALTSWHPYLAVAGELQAEIHTTGLTEGTGRDLGVIIQLMQLVHLIFSKNQLSLKGDSDLVLLERQGELHGGTILW